MPTRLNAVDGTALREIRKGRLWIAPAIFVLLSLCFVPGSVGTAAADWSPLVERLVADGFSRPEVEALFVRPEVRFEPDAMADKIRVLIGNRSLPESVAARLRNSVRRDYLAKKPIARARAYIMENRAVLEETESLYGVPKEVIVSILLLETHLGRNTGHRSVFNRLASMALSADFDRVRPHLGGDLLTAENEEFSRRRCREKGDWAYDELRALLRLAARDGLDPLGIKGSIYGAIGLCQFMPSNVFLYGVDADRDGRVDPFATSDALHSIANYLRGHGWRPGMDRGGQHRVIFEYNHSTVYANTILAVAERLGRRTRP